ncbi:glutathione S-transferase family protein [Mesorhizobium sp. NBSH29]|uniref:glutathione S-transferase family protein n=1 Tax=Mesorhizobium sp. NBSH29 TaxID=2654249 RepID=UPI001896A297|nr:glutathione S-transferase family protein [Mesorhizobium sp. NBSH29]QPC87332.1 glutathione S-transferase family protein [Mesorhizobium sp. NBSH29]
MTISLYDLVGSDPARPFSPHCWKTRMALAHKGLDFTSIPVRFTEIPKIEGGAPKIVPVIRDGDTVVADSFAIALYLEENYADRPTLFGGAGGEAMARFIERWSQSTLHPYLGSAALVDIHERLGAQDKEYFRSTREARYKRTLEEVVAGREAGLVAFRHALEPLRQTLGFHPWIGGQTPLFADYIIFGALQWMRVISPFQPLAEDDVISAWFERCLDLHGAAGKAVSAVDSRF